MPVCPPLVGLSARRRKERGDQLHSGVAGARKNLMARLRIHPVTIAERWIHIGSIRRGGGSEDAFGTAQGGRRHVAEASPVFPGSSGTGQTRNLTTLKMNGELEAIASRDCIIRRIWSLVGLPGARASMTKLSLAPTPAVERSSTESVLGKQSCRRT